MANLVVTESELNFLLRKAERKGVAEVIKMLNYAKDHRGE